MLRLNLPEYSYKLRKKAGRLFIFDVVRKKYVALTPEEWVRQHFIHYLISDKGIVAGSISLEFGSSYNGLDKRCDILVWDSSLSPWLLIECKAPQVAITEKSLAQISVYNVKLQAPFLGVTNGINQYFFQKDGDSYSPVPDIPAMSLPSSTPLIS